MRTLPWVSRGIVRTLPPLRSDATGRKGNLRVPKNASWTKEVPEEGNSIAAARGVPQMPVCEEAVDVNRLITPCLGKALIGDYEKKGTKHSRPTL